MAYILGFEPDGWISVNYRRMVPYCTGIKAGMFNPFVYTDILQYQMAGDSYSPLLCIDDIAGSFIYSLIQFTLNKV